VSSTAVLLVEDERGLAENIRRYLQHHEFEARVSPTVADALVQFERFRPDIVVLDFKLPDGDGLGLLERIRQSEPLMPVIMISGEGGVDVAVRRDGLSLQARGAGGADATARTCRRA
jgi:DNA-binding response OmpR family regulator